MSALLKFWRSAYRRYEVPHSGGLAFHVPALPDPLVSPRFVRGGDARHFNEIAPLGSAARPPAGFRLDKQFYLGERPIAPRALPAGFAVRVVPLARAGSALAPFLAEGFPRDAGFLAGTLLPFLAGLDAEFRSIFLVEEARDVGAVTVGVAGGVAIVLNAVVPAAERGRGLSRILTAAAEDAAASLGAREAFFWTEHPFFAGHAHEWRHYRVFVRA
jgi:hypothetical protein